jgi:hypothetical protein
MIPHSDPEHNDQFERVLARIDACFYCSLLTNAMFTVLILVVLSK